MSKLGNNIGYRILRKKAKSVVRNKCVQNFETADTAIILFDTSIEGCFESIKTFAKYLKSRGIKTAVLGLVHSKEVPENMLLWQNYKYITKAQINWLGRPKGEVVEKFYKLEPDILFVFSLVENLTIEYLTQLSTAKFKVGCYTERPNDLDLMINPNKRECTADFFIEQVQHYVDILSPAE